MPYNINYITDIFCINIKGHDIIATPFLIETGVKNIGILLPPGVRQIIEHAPSFKLANNKKNLLGLHFRCHDYLGKENPDPKFTNNHKPLAKICWKRGQLARSQERSIIDACALFVAKDKLTLSRTDGGHLLLLANGVAQVMFSFVFVCISVHNRGPSTGPFTHQTCSNLFKLDFTA